MISLANSTVDTKFRLSDRCTSCNRKVKNAVTSYQLRINGRQIEFLPDNSRMHQQCAEKFVHTVLNIIRGGAK